jgi:hypothetical protein
MALDECHGRLPDADHNAQIISGGSVKTIKPLLLLVCAAMAAIAFAAPAVASASEPAIWTVEGERLTEDAAVELAGEMGFTSASGGVACPESSMDLTLKPGNTGELTSQSALPSSCEVSGNLGAVCGVHSLTGMSRFFSVEAETENLVFKNTVIKYTFSKGTVFCPGEVTLKGDVEVTSENPITNVELQGAMEASANIGTASIFGALQATPYALYGTTLAPEAGATTEAATTMKSHSALLHGLVNPEGSQASYYFEYGATTSYGSKSISGKLGSGVEATPVSQEISGLSPNTQYHFRMVATNAAGSTFGKDTTFTTGAGGSSNWTQEGEPLLEGRQVDFEGDLGWVSSLGGMKCATAGALYLQPGTEGEVAGIGFEGCELTGGYASSCGANDVKSVTPVGFPWTIVNEGGSIQIPDFAVTVKSKSGNCLKNMDPVEGELTAAPNDATAISSTTLSGMVGNESTGSKLWEGTLNWLPAGVYGLTE